MVNRLWLGLGSLASLLTVACAEPTCGPAQLCDVRDESCQALAQEIASCYAEQDLEAKVAVRVLSEAERLTQWQRDQRERPQQERADAQVWREGLALMFLVPEESDLQDAFEFRTPLATYTPRDSQITLTAEYLPPKRSAAELLVHEYVHALQDERGAFNSDGPQTTDAWLAGSAMMEGEGQIYGTFTSAEGFGFHLDDLRGGAFTPDLTRPGERPYDSAYDFTYDYGAAWIIDAWRAGGATRVARQTLKPPKSTRHVMAGFGSDDPVDRAARQRFEQTAEPEIPPRFRKADADTLGAWILSYFGAEGWVGDRLHVFVDDDSQETLAVWRMRFDSKRQAKDVRAHIQRKLERATRRSDGAQPRSPEVEDTTLTWIRSSDPESVVDVLRWLPLEEVSP